MSLPIFSISLIRNSGLLKREAVSIYNHKEHQVKLPINVWSNTPSGWKPFPLLFTQQWKTSSSLTLCALRAFVVQPLSSIHDDYRLHIALLIFFGQGEIMLDNFADQLFKTYYGLPIHFQIRVPERILGAEFVYDEA
jgi:hypothetical protein